MEGPTNSKEIAPASASWTVDYLMDVDLKSKDGTDIPLYNKHLRYGEDDGYTRNLGIRQQVGDKSERFDTEKEDYWLFHIHSNHADFEIAIGGETPVLVNSKPNWNKCSDEDTDVIWKSHKWEDPSSSKNHVWLRSWVVFEDEKKGCFNRFVAVRCPKMDNPAITIKGSGHFACLHWVGLFLKTTTNDTNKLLPDYGERNRTAGYEWFDEDGPADVTNRTLTLFPKQLYGTNGNDPVLYDRFVTTDPENLLGQKHFDLVRSMFEQKSALSAYKYTWHASGRTLIKTADDSFWQEPYMSGETTLDYVSGIEVIPSTVNGWTVLLTVFTSVTKIATGLFTANFGSIVSGIFDMTDVFDEKKMRETADLKGFVTAAAEAVDEYNKKFPENKKKKPNSADVPTINLEIQNETVLHMHFGTSYIGTKTNA
ncbi:hypothetical protein IFM46972_10960 [Aspergillus udagawae]|uniref:Uncharacterized protein n=1 Tax=Aspergillus udagawae TaxID=91492 RepID=A0A8H3SF81_9EURO|nr:hypothetical protein IFM46972_10960 [Aspergillus udagawae]